MFKRIKKIKQSKLYKKYRRGWLTLGFLLFVYLCIEFNFLWLFGNMPNFDRVKNPIIEVPSKVMSADSVYLGSYYRENRTLVAYKDINPMLLKTLIATEDTKFYSHHGIDWGATVSIFYYMLKGDKRGGSTITQQLAKNLYKTRKLEGQGLLGHIPGVKVVVAKLKEWITAVKIERIYTKNEIITMYLNTVDFGYHSYGIYTASKTFFSTTPKKLKPQEMAVLVGLLKATSLYSPVLNPKNSLNRRNTVLGIMARDKVITQEQADSLKKLPIELHLDRSKKTDGYALYFRDFVEREMNKWCEENGYDLYADGLKIYTTVDSRLQKHAESALEEHLKKLQRQFFKHWDGKSPWRDADDNEIPGFINTAIKQTSIYRSLQEKYPDDEKKIKELLNKPKPMRIFTWRGEKDTILSSIDSLKYYKHMLMSGFLVMDPKKAHVKAWVGGINHKYFQFDHVSQSKRQPGSTFKPFVYLAAIDGFGYSPCDTLKDEPITYRYVEDSAGVKVKRVWTPRNSDRVFSYRNMTLRWAMGRSVNSITSKLINEVGFDNVIKYAKKSGIKSELQRVPSVGLGSSDVTLLELVSAYGTFLNEGRQADPIYITRIEDKHGRVLAEFKPKFKQVISEETAWLMLYMLRGGLEEPNGTSQALFQYDLFRGNELAGKTGTSSNYSDGWFVGLTKDLVGGAWVGATDRSVHFRTSSMGEGSKTALPIFGKFLERSYRDKKSGVKMGYFPKPKRPISKPHDCRTFIREIDSVMVDTLAVPIDSLNVDIEVPNLDRVD